MKKNSFRQKQTTKKTIVINCFTGEEQEVDRRRIQIIDGMEIGNTRVQLDNGVTLTVAGEGKYHTLGNPRQRWAEVAEVRVLPDGEYGDGELLGWTPLFSDGPKKASAPKGGSRVPALGQGKSAPKARSASKRQDGGKPPRPASGKPEKSDASSQKLPPLPKKNRT